MQLRKLENSVLENFTYFEIVIFPFEGKSGHHYPVAYKTLKNAKKTALKLFNDGNYCVMVRRNEVIKQVPYTTDFSINSPIYKLERDKEVVNYENRDI